MPRLPDALTEPDPVIEAYKRDVDRTLLRENLKLTPAQRLAKLQSMCDSLDRLRGLARRVPRGSEVAPR